jgi:predicted aldo/keto reductase-like oxidoreductase
MKMPAPAPAVGVPRRPFGKKGVDVSCLGLGTMFDTIGGRIVLGRAVDLGVTYWDTADCYEGGNSEVGIGRYFEKHPDHRDRVFLVSKSDDRDAEGLTRLLARSLDRLKTGRIDLYLLHGVSSIDQVDRPEIRTWAEKAKKDGRIRFFGMSFHKNMEPLLEGAARLPWIDGVLFTYSYRHRGSARMQDAIAACAAAGTGLVAMKFRGDKGGGLPEAEAAPLWRRHAKPGVPDEHAKLKALLEDRRISSVLATMEDVETLAALAGAVAGT